jgi:hypothetical protein
LFQKNYEAIDCNDEISKVTSSYLSIANGILREYRLMKEQYRKDNGLDDNSLYEDSNNLNNKNDSNEYDSNEYDIDYLNNEYDNIFNAASDINNGNTNVFSFPLIVCCFTTNGRLKISQGWISSFSVPNTNIHIIGYYEIFVKNTEYLKRYLISKEYSLIHNLEYTFKFHEDDLANPFSKKYVSTNCDKSYKVIPDCIGVVKGWSKDNIYGDLRRIDINNDTITINGEPTTFGSYNDNRIDSEKENGERENRGKENEKLNGGKRKKIIKTRKNNKKQKIKTRKNKNKKK